jgi:hypothetical protein
MRGAGSLWAIDCGRLRLSRVRARSTGELRLNHSLGFKLKLPFGSELCISEEVTQRVIWAENVFGWLAAGVILAVVSGLLKRN